MTVTQNSIDHTDFVGRYLAEIGLGVGTISLRLATSGGPGASSAVVVVISGEFSLTIDGHDYSGRAPAPELAMAVSTLLNESITEVTIDERSRARFTFGPNRFIEIHPDPSGFESATINIPGKNTFVI